MKKYALCFGLNDYPGTQSDLNGCVNDVKDWSTVLDNHGFDVQRLLDEQATRSAVLSALRSILSLAQKGDSVVVQNSSHGTQIPDASGDEADGFDEALCVQSDDNQSIDLIYDDELWQLFKMKRPGVRLVWIADSCHSGTVMRAVAPQYEGKPKFLPFDQIKHLIKPRMNRPKTKSFLSAIIDLIRYANVPRSNANDERSPWPCLLLAGCQENEYCYDASFQSRPNGAFSYYMIKSLTGLKPDATYTDWYQAVMHILPSRQYPQKPNMLGSFTNTKILT